MKREDLFRAIGLIPDKYLTECESTRFTSFECYRRPVLIFAMTLIAAVFAVFGYRQLHSPVPSPSPDIPAVIVTPTPEPAEEIRDPFPGYCFADEEPHSDLHYLRPEQYTRPTPMAGAAGADGNSMSYYYVTYYEGPLHSLFLEEEDDSIAVERLVSLNDAAYRGVEISATEAYYRWRDTQPKELNYEEEMQKQEEFNEFYPDGESYHIVSPRMTTKDSYRLDNLGKRKGIVLYYPFESALEDLEYNMPTITLTDHISDVRSRTVEADPEIYVLKEKDDGSSETVPLEQFADDGESHLVLLKIKAVLWNRMDVTADFGKRSLCEHEAGSPEYRILNDGNIRLTAFVLDKGNLRGLDYDFSSFIEDNLVDNKIPLYCLPADLEEISFTIR